MMSLTDSFSQTLSSSERNKAKQKRKILNLLHTGGYISAPVLSKLLKISLPTCISLLNDLKEGGYVKNFGIGKSSGGRKPNLYGLPENAFYAIACDFDRFSANMAVCDCYNRLVTPVVKIDTNIDDPELAEKLFATAQTLLKEHHLNYDKVIGLGVGMPGLIDSNLGINYTIKDVRFRNVRHDLHKRFNKFVHIDNDARMHAYGEFHFGKAKEFNNAIIIHWSWGIGLGIFVDGHLYSGNNGFAGEFSHIPIVDNGDLCICGKRGCLETIASSNTIIKKIAQGIENQEISSVVMQYGDKPEQITPNVVIDSAKAGDEFCISILNEIGMAMGKGLSYIIQLLNPAIIVISGPLAKANQFVLYPIQQSLSRLCLEKISGNTQIVISDMGEHSALLGTSEMIFQRIFSDANTKSLIL